MGEQHYSTAILAAFGGFAGGFCVYLFTGYVMTESAWCIAGEEHCVRNWVSALSGYAAALAALGTIIFLNKQLSEQKKQTSFLLGDANPSMDIAYDVDDPELLVIRIVNWNRRGILLVMLDVKGLGDAQWGLVETKLNDEVIEDAKLVASQRYLRGWENRSGAPATLQWKIAASRDNKIIKKWPKETVVRAGIHLYDEKPRRFTMKSHLYPDNTAFPD